LNSSMVFLQKPGANLLSVGSTMVDAAATARADSKRSVNHIGILGTGREFKCCSDSFRSDEGCLCAVEGKYCPSMGEFVLAEPVKRRRDLVIHQPRTGYNTQSPPSSAVSAAHKLQIWSIICGETCLSSTLIKTNSRPQHHDIKMPSLA
jgi:hypothetical protein